MHVHLIVVVILLHNSHVASIWIDVLKLYESGNLEDGTIFMHLDARCGSSPGCSDSCCFILEALYIIDFGPGPLFPVHFHVLIRFSFPPWEEQGTVAGEGFNMVAKCAVHGKPGIDGCILVVIVL